MVYHLNGLSLVNIFHSIIYLLPLLQQYVDVQRLMVQEGKNRTGDAAYEKNGVIGIMYAYNRNTDRGLQFVRY